MEARFDPGYRVPLSCILMLAPKRRRWFSLSLRTVMIGMTVTSVGFGWFLHYRRGL